MKTPELALTLSLTLPAIACATDASSPGVDDDGGAQTGSSDGATASGASTAMTVGTTDGDGSGGATGGTVDESSGTDPDPSADGSDSESTGGPAQPGPDFRLLGPHRIETTSGNAMADSCTMGYDAVAPVDAADAPVVVLAHGFAGNRGSMRGWAEHWASWGLRVVFPDLCHATIVDADHAANGADLVALAQSLAIDAPIYAGYSAGGLASVIAASMDPGAVALVGLDMVDSGGLGADAAAQVAVPAHGIVSEPAMCNSTANGVPVFSAIADASVVRIFEADHCDFQDPPDALCTLCASPNATQSPEAIHAAILGLSTAALLWRAGLDETGAQWWTAGGPYYDAWIIDATIGQL